MSLEKNPNFLLNLSVGEMNGEGKHFYRFRSFRLDVEERQLLHHGEAVQLTPKAFDVLAMLVENGGHLVEKEELLQTVWADSFVEEANIPRIIHTLRKALGEGENHQKFIETIPKKGYRFVAKVTEVRPKDAPKMENGNGHSENFVEKPFETEAEIKPPENAATANSPEINFKPKTRIILFAVGFLTAVFLLLLVSFNFQSGSSVRPNKSIAVLPLKPINTAIRDELYEIGIADSLIHRLSAMKGFIVRPLSATRKYADLNQDPLVAGKEQEVDYVLASNYQLADGKIRITAQLFNAANGQIEETYKTEKDAANLFALQDAVAGEIGNLLQTTFSTTSRRPSAKRGTNNEEAYWLYLEGKASASRKLPGDLKIAVEYFEKAIRLDPNFANAYSGLAYALVAKDSDSRGRHGIIQKARESVAKALELDNNLAEAFAVLGEIEFKYDWDFPKAEKNLLHAIELDPNSELAHAAYGEFLSVQGRFDEAIRELKLALEINKDNCATQIIYGRAFFLAQHYDEAIVQFKRVIEVDERFGGAFGFLWLSYEMKGDEATAFEWFMKNQKRNNAQKNPELIAAYQKAYDTAGWHGVWRKILELNSNEFDSGNYYTVARVAVRLGEKEQAFVYLNKALEMRQSQLTMLHLDPFFDPLHDDPRFAELVKRIGSK